jgi:hypothetical protein
MLGDVNASPDFIAEAAKQDTLPPRQCRRMPEAAAESSRRA